MKVAAGEIDLPLVRMENSQKSARGVHLTDLANYLDERHRTAKEEHESSWGAEPCAVHPNLPPTGPRSWGPLLSAQPRPVFVLVAVPSQMRVSPHRIPVPVARDAGHARNIPSDLEKPTDAVMAQVVKVEIIDLKLQALVNEALTDFAL